MKTAAAAAVIVAAGMYAKWAAKPALAGFRLGRELERRLAYGRTSPAPRGD